MKAFDVVGIGTAVVDYLGVVPHYPELDSQVELKEFSKQGGGNVATALVTLARLGASTCFLGKIGDDELARFVLDGLRAEGIDVAQTVIETNASVGFAFIMVDSTTGKRTILWTNQGKSHLSAEELTREQILAGRFLHLDEYEMDAAIAAAKLAQNSSVKVVLDAESGLSGIETLLPLVDIVIASNDFANAYSGLSDFQAAAKFLHNQLQDTLVIVTAGEQGCYCVTNDDSFHQPAFVVDPVDTTGCGDVFHGAFIYGLLHDWNLRKTAEFSCAAAALKCRALGGRAGIANLSEVEAFLAQQQRAKNA